MHKKIKIYIARKNATERRRKKQTILSHTRQKCVRARASSAMLQADLGFNAIANIIVYFIFLSFFFHQPNEIFKILGNFRARVSFDWCQDVTKRVANASICSIVCGRVVAAQGRYTMKNKLLSIKRNGRNKKKN